MDYCRSPSCSRRRSTISPAANDRETYVKRSRSKGGGRDYREEPRRDEYSRRDRSPYDHRRDPYCSRTYERGDYYDRAPPTRDYREYSYEKYSDRYDRYDDYDRRPPPQNYYNDRYERRPYCEDRYGGPPPSRRYQRRYSPPRKQVSSRPRPENVEPSNVLGVFGLSVRTTESTLEQFFNQFAPVKSCKIIVDRVSGNSKGFGFVYFDSIEDARRARDSALESAQGNGNGNEQSSVLLDGRNVRIDYSLTQKPHSPTPGIYMGDPKAVRRLRENFPPNSRSHHDDSSQNRQRHRSLSRSRSR